MNLLPSSIYEIALIDGIFHLLGTISSDPDFILRCMLWLLLLFGVFQVFWAFYLKFNRNIKSGEFIERLVYCAILFVCLFLTLDYIGINMIG